MPIYQAVVLAIIQGLAEFIPISSSGHLIIARRLLGWNELSPAHELTFDVALHFGTLLSVLFYFRRTWFQIVWAAFGGKVVRFSEASSSDGNLTTDEQRQERLLLWFLAIATIPGAIAGKLLEHSAEDYFREHIFLIAGGVDSCGPDDVVGRESQPTQETAHRNQFCGCRHRGLRSGDCAVARSFTVGINHHRGLVSQYDARSRRALQFSALDTAHRWRGAA